MRIAGLPLANGLVCTAAKARVCGRYVRCGDCRHVHHLMLLTLQEHGHGLPDSAGTSHNADLGPRLQRHMRTVIHRVSTLTAWMRGGALAERADA